MASPIARTREITNSSRFSVRRSTPVLSRRTLNTRQTSSTKLCTTTSVHAQNTDDNMIYLDGPQVYTCAQCRTHLTSHDDIISKSFHGRHGRAYLFDQCVNITTGPPEDRLLITGLHSVCDMFCKRCSKLVGWTYTKAYEPSQKYKEGKFIIEKIHLFMETSHVYQVIPHPAGERQDKFRQRSMSWGSEDKSMPSANHFVYEYFISTPKTSPEHMAMSSSSFSSASSFNSPPFL